MNHSERFYKIFHPRFLFALALVPFMCVCPLVLFSVTIGFPYPYIQNNVQLRTYTDIFTDIYDSVEGVTPVGSYYSKIASIKQRRGTCTLFAGHAAVTNLSQQEISSVYLKQFTTIASQYQSDADVYQLLRNSEIKVIPIDINEPFSNTDVVLNLRRDFNVSDEDIPVNENTDQEKKGENGEVLIQEQATNPEIPAEKIQSEAPEVTVTENLEPSNPRVMYLVYLVNTKAFESLDFRCN